MFKMSTISYNHWKKELKTSKIDQIQFSFQRYSKLNKLTIKGF